MKEGDDGYGELEMRNAFLEERLKLETQRVEFVCCVGVCGG